VKSRTFASKSRTNRSLYFARNLKYSAKIIHFKTSYFTRNLNHLARLIKHFARNSSILLKISSVMLEISVILLEVSINLLKFSINWFEQFRLLLCTSTCFCGRRSHFYDWDFDFSGHSVKVVTFTYRISSFRIIVFGLPFFSDHTQASLERRQSRRRPSSQRLPVLLNNKTYKFLPFLF